MAQWKAGWAQRIAIAIDDTNVDATLTWFAVPLIINSSCGIGADDMATIVFGELGASYLKLAVTKDDGVTELKVEKEEWTYNAGTVADSTGVLWVSITGWEIPTSGATIYLYYDAGHADNTTNVGVIGSTVGEDVWDANAMATYHMVDATTATVLDSTDNSHDIAKKAANQPVELAGEIAEAQRLDGTDDYMTLPSSNDFTPASGTFETWIRREEDWDIDEQAWTIAWCKPDGSYNGNGWYLTVDTRPDPNWYALVAVWDGAGTANTVVEIDPNTFFPLDTWVHIALKWTASGAAKIFKNGVSQTVVDGFTSVTPSGDNSWLGFSSPTYANGHIQADYDETRFSDTPRADAWIKANFYAQSDNFLTWGDVEIGFIPQVTMF